MDMPFAPYYEQDGIVIYNADCRQVLPFLPKFDLLLTDPPYGIGESSKKQKTRGGFTKFKDGSSTGRSTFIAAKDYGENDWDREPPERWVLLSAQAAARTQILWGGNYYGLPASSCWLVWDKDNTGDFADCELAWTNMARAVRKFKWRWNGMLQENMGDKKEGRSHPTQKPLALMRWCLSLVPDAQTILDPFAGSCTTGVAAKLEGRKAVLIEINEKYCEIGANRLSQGVLF